MNIKNRNKLKIILGSIGTIGISISSAATCMMTQTSINTDVAKNNEVFTHGVGYANGTSEFENEFHPVPTSLSVLANNYHVDVSAFQEYFSNNAPRITMQLKSGSTPVAPISQFDAFSKDIWVRALSEFQTANPSFDATNFEFIAQMSGTGTFIQDIQNAEFNAGEKGTIYLYDKIRNEYVSDFSTTFKSLDTQGSSIASKSPFYYNDGHETFTDTTKQGYTAFADGDSLTATDLVRQILESIRTQIPELNAIHSDALQGKNVFNQHGLYSLNIAGINDTNWQQSMQISTTPDMKNLLTTIPQIEYATGGSLYVALKNVDVVETNSQGNIVNTIQTGKTFDGANIIQLKIYSWSQAANYMNLEYGRMQSIFDFYPVKFGIGDDDATMEMKLQAVTKLFSTNPIFGAHIDSSATPIIISSANKIDTSVAGNGTAVVNVLQPRLDLGMDNIITQIGGSQDLVDLNFNIKYVVERQDHMFSHPYNPAGGDTVHSVFDESGFFTTLDNIYESNGEAIDFKTGGIKWDFDKDYQYMGTYMKDITSQFGGDHHFARVIQDMALDGSSDSPLEADTMSNRTLNDDGTQAYDESMIQGKPDFYALDDGEYGETVNTFTADNAALSAYNVSQNAGNLIGLFVALHKAVAHLPTTVAIYQNFAWEHTSQGEWTTITGKSVTFNETFGWDDAATMAVVFVGILLVTLAVESPAIISSLTSSGFASSMCDIMDSISTAIKNQFSSVEEEGFTEFLDEDVTSPTVLGDQTLPDETLDAINVKVSNWLNDDDNIQSPEFYASRSQRNLSAEEFRISLNIPSNTEEEILFQTLEQMNADVALGADAETLEEVPQLFYSGFDQRASESIDNYLWSSPSAWAPQSSSYNDDQDTMYSMGSILHFKSCFAPNV